MFQLTSSEIIAKLNDDIARTKERCVTVLIDIVNELTSSDSNFVPSELKNDAISVVNDYNNVMVTLNTIKSTIQSIADSQPTKIR